MLQLLLLLLLPSVQTGTKCFGSKCYDFSRPESEGQSISCDLQYNYCLVQYPYLQCRPVEGGDTSSMKVCSDDERCEHFSQTGLPYCQSGQSSAAVIWLLIILAVILLIIIIIVCSRQCCRNTQTTVISATFGPPEPNDHQPPVHQNRASCPPQPNFAQPSEPPGYSGDPAPPRYDDVVNSSNKYKPYPVPDI